MDTSKQPGIAIEKINLLACNAQVRDANAELRYAMGLTNLSRKEEGTHLIVVATFDMMHGIKNPPCNLLCSFLAEYSQDETPNMTWAEFTDVMAVTHMIPYVREFVSSVTLRMPIRELILPPVNAHVLINSYKAEQENKPQA